MRRIISLILVLNILTSLLTTFSLNVVAATGSEMVNFAKSVTGYYYNPSNGESRLGPTTFDCSGFVYYVCSNVGITMSSGSTENQRAYGIDVDHTSLRNNNDYSNLKAGDLVFFDWDGGNSSGHVGIYIGNGQIIHCWSKAGTPIKIHSFSDWGTNYGRFYQYVCDVRRVAADTHTHSFWIEYEAIHPHKEYRRCSCGYTEYTGYIPDGYSLENEILHPHKEYKRCYNCDYIEYTGNIKVVSTCSQCTTPGKPSLSNMHKKYLTDIESDVAYIRFSWTITESTTDYQLNIVKDSADGNYKMVKRVSNAQNGVIVDLPVGDYCAYVYSINANSGIEVESAWKSFSVEDGNNILNNHTAAATSVHGFDSYYLKFDHATTWYNAKVICEKLGGHLATINSKEEYDNLKTITGDNHYFLGGTDEETEGNWEWITGEIWNYNDFWNTGEPNNANAYGEEDALLFGTVGNDVPADDSYGFICEMSGNVLGYNEKNESVILDWCIIDDYLYIYNNSDFDTVFLSSYNYGDPIWCEGPLWKYDRDLKGVKIGKGIELQDGSSLRKILWYSKEAEPYQSEIYDPDFKIADYMFCDKDMTKIFYAFPTIESSVEIPSTVKEIDKYAFKQCENVYEIIINEGTETIGECAFSSCSNLKKVVLPKSIINIGYGAFPSGVKIYYEGTREEWNQIVGNQQLLNATIHFKEENIKAESITIDKSDLELKVGETAVINATVSPSDATSKNIVWFSSDNTVATVSNGSVSAVGTGCVTITATTEDGGYTATCIVTVYSPVINVDAIFTLSDATGKAGDEVKVKLSLKSAKNVNTIAISNINYSDKLIFQGFSDYKNISDLAAITPTFDEMNKAIVIGLKNSVPYNGDICTLNFRIMDDAEDGILFVSANSIVKLNSTIVDSVVNPATVTVTSQILGDINGDENVDLQDAIALLNHSMLPEIYPIPYVGSVDFYKDGSIDLQDAILLLNYSMLPDIYPIG